MRLFPPITLVLLLAACGASGPRTPAAGEKLRVLATTPHLAALAMAVAGEDAHVELLPPEGKTSHDFEPAMADRKRLEQAHLLLANGLALEGYDCAKLAEAASLRWVDCSAGIPDAFLLKAGAEEAGHSHGGRAQGTHNPHVWLSVEGALYQLAAVTDAFVAGDAGHAEGYRTRSRALADRLKALRDEFAPRLAALPGKAFVSNHDAFPYFAREFGLSQVGVIQRVPGVNPTLEQRRELEARIRDSKARAIFLEPGYDDAASEAIARNAGVKLAVLDPFDSGKPAPDALEKALRANLETVLKTLGD
ncbi:MAG: zinc ABC transporter substrate-binding protein [Planctomycetes bacterium]|nr:zinc ABC transporter substrate-binding protein [Planctomycetota bacterium]